jgi:septal ring factor EnvC (AmiA/AmiB activator)
MSNLEDKALTRAQLNCYPYLPFPDTKTFLEAEKWVPLEDAQKEIDRQKEKVDFFYIESNKLEQKKVTAEKLLNQTIKQLLASEAKIEAANNTSTKA